jgi:hypothetical protein
MHRLATFAAAAAMAAPAAMAQSEGPSVGDVRTEDGQIVLENVVAETPGYIVVTENLPQDAAASEPVAIAEVSPGTTDNLVIQGDFTHGGEYVIMLYEESGDEEGFQWREGVQDLPVSEGGEHVTTTFDMIMESGEGDADT